MTKQGITYERHLNDVTIPMKLKSNPAFSNFNLLKSSRVRKPLSLAGPALFGAKRKQEQTRRKN